MRQGEVLERAFGITAGMQEQATGAARRAGQDDQKFIMGAVGTAVASGLEGGRIGEFLMTIADATTQMSRGMNIDSQSLTGFAGALMKLPFFKDDPRRAQAELNSMNKAFSGGDRYQQALAVRAIVERAGPGASAFGTEIRRRMGLFGGGQEALRRTLTPQALKQLRERDPQLFRTLSTEGGDILRSQVDFLVKQNKGLGIGATTLALQDIQGMTPALALHTAITGKLPSKVEQQRIKDAEQKANKTANKTATDLMGTDFGRMADLGQTLDEIHNTLTENIASPLASINENVKKLAGQFGIDVGQAGGDLATAGAIASLIALLGGGKAGGAIGGVLKKGGGLLGRGAMAAPGAMMAAAPWLGAGLVGAGAGALVGTGVDKLADVTTGANTRYGGPKANIFERMMGKAFMSDDEFKSTYGSVWSGDTSGEDPILAKAGQMRKAGGGVADVDGGIGKSTEATAENTGALKDLTAAMNKIANQGGPIRDRQQALPTPNRKVGM